MPNFSTKMIPFNATRSAVGLRPGPLRDDEMAPGSNAARPFKARLIVLLAAVLVTQATTLVVSIVVGACTIGIPK
jgi:hypothetical protein